MLVLPQTLTSVQARDTLRMLEPAIRNDSAATLAVDASGLEAFDSAAVAVLLECRRQAQAYGRGFDLRGVPPKLGELIRLYGVESLLAFAPPPVAR